MKKIFAILLALLAAALACFFIGWAQFAVPPGSVGVLRSKSHGLETNSIEGGDFTWVWYKLIPTNVTISPFKLSAQPLVFEANGALSQADVYAAFTGIKTDFAYTVELSAEYTVKPESLPELVSLHDIYKQEDLDALLGVLNEKIKLFAAGVIAGSMQSRDAPSQSGEEEAAALLQKTLAAEYPYLQWLDVSVYPRKEPDFELYAAAKETYTLYLERQSEILRKEAARRAGERSASDFYREELEKYGELITRYPFLIEYLKITKESEAKGTP